MKNLERDSFETYPHYVYATVFLLDGKLMDYKIGNQEKCWETRTFRGQEWENYVFDNFQKLNLYCEYKKILVNNADEHNEAFEILEKWIHKNYETYKGL